jgi:hypothetical protein
MLYICIQFEAMNNEMVGIEKKSRRKRLVPVSPRVETRHLPAALIEKGKDGRFGIFTPDIKSTIIGEGTTVGEAKADFENSVKEIIESFVESGKSLPEELLNLEFVYKYDLASIFDYYSWINVTQFAKVAGVNSSLLRQYKSGVAYISEEQVRKIEKAFHKAGKELASAQLI